jgi:pyridoxal phosphate enzyme (YggS family)
LSPDAVRRTYERIKADVGDAVTVVAATKYVSVQDMAILAEAGVEVVGENRAQDLEAKAAAQPELTWDFIGHLQSRKVKQVLPHVRYLHSVSTESVLKQLERHGTPKTEVLVEVNIAAEEGKSGIAPDALDDFIARCREVGGVEVAGLMTMPPLAADPADSRRWFAALAELAAARGLPELSMGTTQDFTVAVQEGSTIVRVGTKLYR